MMVVSGRASDARLSHGFAAAARGRHKQIALSITIQGEKFFFTGFGAPADFEYEAYFITPESARCSRWASPCEPISILRPGFLPDPSPPSF
jgi:hypothetical protein